MASPHTESCGHHILVLSQDCSNLVLCRSRRFEREQFEQLVEPHAHMPSQAVASFTFTAFEILACWDHFAIATA